MQANASEGRYRWSRDGFDMLPAAVDVTDLERTVTAGISKWPSSQPEQCGITSSGELQAVYGVHLMHPAASRPIQALNVHSLLASRIGGPFYLYQSQLHLKPPSSGELLWHQDYRAYSSHDGLATDSGAIVGVFLDEIGENDAPVVVLPGSHTKGLVECSFDLEVPSQGPAGREGKETKVQPRITDEVIAREFPSAEERALCGPRGTVFAMHPCLIHRSGRNRGQRRRAILYLNVFSVDNNHHSPRPEFVVSSSYEPILPIPNR